MKLILLATTAVAAFASASSAGPSASESGVIHVTVTPGHLREQDGGTVAITETISAPSFADRLTLSLNTRAPGMSHAQPVEELTVSDASGSVVGKLDRNDDQGSFVWTASRPTSGVVTARYALPIKNDNRATGGPPTYVRIDGDAVSGVGGMLFLQPKLEGRYAIRIDWDLSALGAGGQAVSTYGDGNLDLPAGPLDRMDESFFMAGHLKWYTPKDAPNFSAVWAKDPGFDPAVPLHWSAQLYKWMSRFFGDAAPPRYRIFMRYNPAANAGGGAGFPHSYLWTFGQGVAAEHMKSILGHEMTHTWTAGVSKWFDEGDAVYYQQRLPWRAGMISTATYLKDINDTAARYYTNELIHMPDKEVMAAYWSDLRRVVIPYDRGAMYLAAVDAQIGHASHGRRSVDDLIRAIVAKLRAGERLNDATWVALVRKELGQPGVAGYEAMMAGRTIIPASDAFGPCFQRVDAMIRRYEVGFKVKRLEDGETRVVENLEPSSEAARAGIRDGDGIVLRTNTDGAQRDPTMTLTVKVTRDGNTFPITYLPRGEAVPAYQWERAANIPESVCRLRFRS